ncbi:MAG: glutamate racemase [Candidatus Wallbacteria bacterium]
MKSRLLKENQKPIGIFDSGLGGLTVLSAIRKNLPQENIIYFGDTARVPYGTKSPAIVERYTMEIVNFLMSCDVKMIVIACNTSTAIAYKKVCHKIKIPVIGVIEPASMVAASITRNKRIGVIGTSITVQSGAYLEKIKQFDNKIEVFQKACPLFVPIVEEGRFIESEILKDIASEYLSDFDDKNIDTLILGCTHYPLIRNIISGVMGENVNIIDSAIQTSLYVKNVLEANELLNKNKKMGTEKFYLTDASCNFVTTGERFLNRPIKNVKTVKVWDILLQ